MGDESRRAETIGFYSAERTVAKKKKNYALWNLILAARENDGEKLLSRAKMVPDDFYKPRTGTNVKSHV